MVMPSRGLASAAAVARQAVRVNRRFVSCSNLVFWVHTKVSMSHAINCLPPIDFHCTCESSSVCSATSIFFRSLTNLITMACRTDIATFGRVNSITGPSGVNSAKRCSIRLYSHPGCWSARHCDC